MNPKFKRLLGFIAFAIGIGLLTSMTTQLHRGAEAGESYREAISPFIPERPGIWSGTKEEAKKFDVRIPMDEQGSIRSLQFQTKNQISPDFARWLLYLGVFLLIFGAPMIGQLKVETAKEGAEQDGESDS
jgi:hypothetical protein